MERSISGAMMMLPGISLPVTGSVDGGLTSLHDASGTFEATGADNGTGEDDVAALKGELLVRGGTGGTGYGCEAAGGGGEAGIIGIGGDASTGAVTPKLMLGAAMAPDGTLTPPKPRLPDNPKPVPNPAATSISEGIFAFCAAKRGSKPPSDIFNLL